MDARLAREGMYYTSKLGMNNGDYAFIMFQLDPLSVEKYVARPQLWFSGGYKMTRNLNVEEEKEFYKMYKSVLLLAFNTKRIDKYNKFADEMKRKMSEPPFCSDAYTGTRKFGNYTIYNFNRTVSM